MREKDLVRHLKRETESAGSRLFNMLLKALYIYSSTPLREKRRTDMECSEVSPWKASLFCHVVQV